MIPRVTVIVATYNSSAILRCALESVRRQDFTDFEAWIVGDACTDDSDAVVAEFNDPRFHWFNRTENSGSGAGPNTEGLARARGDLIAYLGHDDLWFPWHLSALVAKAAETRAVFVHSLLALIGTDGPREIVGPPANGSRYGRHFAPPSCWLHRVGLVAEVGGWRPAPDLPHGVDVDVFARIAGAGHRIVCAPRLSVLKFPSAWWRMYAARTTRPQPGYLERLIADPQMLERDVLQEVALSYARDHFCYRERTGRDVIRQARDVTQDAVRLGRRALAEAYGVDRWPLRGILQRRFQRIRRGLRKDRGLPD